MDGSGSEVFNTAFMSQRLGTVIDWTIKGILGFAALMAWRAAKAATAQQVPPPKPQIELSRYKRKRKLTRADRIAVANADFKSALRLLAAACAMVFYCMTSSFRLYPGQNWWTQVISWFQVGLVYAAIIWAFRSEMISPSELAGLKEHSFFRYIRKTLRYAIFVLPFAALCFAVYVSYFDPQLQELNKNAVEATAKVAEAEEQVRKAQQDKARLERIKTDLEWLQSISPTTTTAPTTRP